MCSKSPVCVTERTVLRSPTGKIASQKEWDQTKSTACRDARLVCPLAKPCIYACILNGTDAQAVRPYMPTSVILIHKMADEASYSNACRDARLVRPLAKPCIYAFNSIQIGIQKWENEWAATHKPHRGFVVYRAGLPNVVRLPRSKMVCESNAVGVAFSFSKHCIQAYGFHVLAYINYRYQL